MAPYVFINFRRADTGATGPHIDTALRAEFGTQAAFRDQRSLPAGRDYREQLERGIRKCDLLLVVMGAHWASVRDDAGRRCIDREEDWVRKEIALALAYKLPVMPVLVDGAKLPSIHELPDDIQSLVHQQVVYFRPHQEHIDFPRSSARSARRSPSCVPCGAAARTAARGPTAEPPSPSIG